MTLKYDNGEGLTFRRTIAIDDRYLFTIKDDVTNVGSAPVTLYPFALISRHGTPEVSGYYILHEGLIGYLGEKGLQEHGYKAIAEAPVLGNGGRGFEFNVTNGWLGITDKYWASALLPDTVGAPQGALPRRTGRQGPLSDRLPAGPADASRSAAPAAPMRGCSPAPRKPASSASTSRSPAMAATTSSSG